MSPRPTKSPGKSSDRPKASSSKSTYFGVAMLPSSTISARSGSGRASPRALLERLRVALLGGVDRHARKGAQVAGRDHGLRRRETPIRGDHEHARASSEGSQSAACQGELAPEVERGDEAEDLAERRAVAAHAPGEIEPGLAPQQQPAARPRAAGRREQEHAVGGHARILPPLDHCEMFGSVRACPRMGERRSSSMEERHSTASRALSTAILIAASLTLGSGRLFAQEPPPPPEALENAFPAKGAPLRKAPSYSPYPGWNFPTRVYWGDTHVHTSASMDAGAFGCRSG